MKFNQVIFGNVIKDLLQRKEDLAKKMKSIEKQKEEFEKDPFQELFVDIFNFCKTHVSLRLLIQISIILLSLLLFYYFNKDKSLFRRILGR